MHKKGDYEEVIPHDTYWEFRWGIQGVRTALRYLDLEKIKDKCRNVDDPPEAKDAHERYRQGLFSCHYGRLGKPRLRKIVELAENRKIAQ